MGNKSRVGYEVLRKKAKKRILGSRPLKTASQLTSRREANRSHRQHALIKQEEERRPASGITDLLPLLREPAAGLDVPPLASQMFALHLGAEILVGRKDEQELVTVPSIKLFEVRLQKKKGKTSLSVSHWSPKRG